MHKLLLVIPVKELPTIDNGIIAIVVTPATQTIATLVEHKILSLGELDGTSDAGDFPTTSGFEIVKPKVGFGAEIQDLHRTPHTGVGHQKKGETPVASMSLYASWLQARWADDEVAQETHYAKGGLSGVSTHISE